ncbi:MAG: alpha/beta fold hydrolase [Moraxella sp.]|nr:alpha/beta fold hydrolase [Moraxella sp.]
MPIYQKTHHLTTSDNANIALHQIGNDNNDKSVFLSHGAFSDKRICMGLANFLVVHGYTCYIIEWRGHSLSSPDNKNHFLKNNPIDNTINLENIARHDFKAAFDYLYNNLNIKQLHCITHSGGGICLTMFLSFYPNYINRIHSMTMVACQAFGAADNLLAYIRLYLARFITKMIGFIPAKILKLGIINESYAMMKSWFDWNLNKQFTSMDKTIDYKDTAKNINIPLYCLCAADDKIIAPVSGCEKFFNLFTHPNNQFKVFGLDNDNLENYNHKRIMLSKNASREVWRDILEWINQHNERQITP